MTADPFDLERFVRAQTPVMAQVLAELESGRKRTHWMWFVFPQLAGLGGSAMARLYAIASLAEARAYLAHPVLGARLKACVSAALASGEHDPRALFGTPDDLKFRSCLTLFAHAAENEPLFREALRVFYGGNEDPATLRLLTNR
ncbi:MAG: DUF1810 domain-containing protein [Proteobacteria bacterium]|nr:DUF1810 domain-containing protein [Pseudomonadota bacterium]